MKYLSREYYADIVIFSGMLVNIVFVGLILYYVVF